MPKFYNTVGDEIPKDDFVQLYKTIYFFKNDVVLENVIEGIYAKGIQASCEEMVDFLRWKVGDMSKREDEITTQYGQKISISRIKKLYDVMAKESWGDADAKEIYNAIVQTRIKNSGAVYSLSLVSLITGGKEPIYDKFADISLTVIMNESHAFRDPVEYVELPDKVDINGVFNRYENYKRRLTKIFDNEWVRSRDVDRALWAYGHMFR